jgi:hypothetical protein
MVAAMGWTWMGGTPLCPFGRYRLGTGQNRRVPVRRRRGWIKVWCGCGGHASQRTRAGQGRAGRGGRPRARFVSTRRPVGYARGSAAANTGLGANHMAAGTGQLLAF